MAIAFSRTLRALEADRPQPATGALLLAIALLGSWLIWFFHADLTRYEVIDHARLEAVSPGALGIVAEFPASVALDSIRPGQSARMHVYEFPWSCYGNLSATVVRVVSAVADGTVRVELTVRPGSEMSIPLRAGLSGSVAVAVGRVSPAELVLRAAGRLPARFGAEPDFPVDRESLAAKDRHAD